MVKEIKEIHPENIVMIKCGNFYKVYGKDAFIISNLFKYSIKEEQEIVSSGFPVNSIKKVEANTCEDTRRKSELLDKCIAKIKIIDFLINLSYTKQIINNKRYLKFGEAIDEIVKYLIGWKKSINKGAQLSICAECFCDWFVWLASRYANCNTSNANFGLRNVNSANLNSNNLFNSNGTANNNNNFVRPVASVNCGYAIINCIRDNIETNCCPIVKNFLTVNQKQINIFVSRHLLEGEYILELFLKVAN